MVLKMAKALLYIICIFYIASISYSIDKLLIL